MSASVKSLFEDPSRLIIKITNTTLHIDKGDFSGDMEEARLAIQGFTSTNTVTFKGFRGYGDLTVNDKNFSINPYGIDISMMLEFCGIELPTQEPAQSPGLKK